MANPTYVAPTYEAKVEHTLTLSKSGTTLGARLVDLERARAFGVPLDAAIMWAADDMVFRWWTPVTAAKDV